MIFGVIIGIIIGALPGLSSTMGVALFIPVTYAMDPGTGLAFLSAIYMASTYGGSISAILICTPGTPAAIITAMDGYELTKQGRSGEALSMATIASFFGGIISVVALMLIAPPLSKLVIEFGSAEMFLLAVLGLTIIVSLSQGSMVKGLIVGLTGVLLATVGTDTLTGAYRFTFDKMELFGGMPVVPTVIGAYSASQVFALAVQKRSTIQYDSEDNVKKTYNIVSVKEIIKNGFNIVRSGIIGTIVGIVPGAGMSIASALAYNTTKNTSKKPGLFGKGSLEGLAASEAANNGVVGGSLVPLLTLGIPGNSVSAVFLGGLIIHGLRPGPSLFTKYANISYTLFIGLLVSTVLMMIAGLVGAKYFGKIATVPTNVIAPVIMSLCVIGSYAIRNNIFDVQVMFAFGLIGYAMSRLKFFSAPLVLGLILGPIAESEFRRAMMISNGDVSAILASGISKFLFLLIIGFLVYPFIQEKVKEFREKKEEPVVEN
ncbi:tripartite tricarboxylate transporter permease [Fusibacter sp. Q10-2]|uniref:Tripartite tricarboxylate transporter permease n=2 Tax=Fusibacter ferrireducens TaxID=2785058 RepID=A0ABR9ZW52_9FIRM|nr:tripartite tricarboxylate transporter permease [Fusibacter ferrireducens]